VTVFSLVIGFIGLLQKSLQVRLMLSLFCIFYSSVQHIFKSSLLAVLSTVFWKRLPTAHIPFPVVSELSTFVGLRKSRLTHQQWNCCVGVRWRSLTCFIVTYFCRFIAQSSTCYKFISHYTFYLLSLQSSY
jgi:hypothetical protein